MSKIKDINYGAILIFSNAEKLISDIKKLEEQKYTPQAYYIVSLNTINKDDTTAIAHYLNKTKKNWKLKIAAKSLGQSDLDITIEDLIDELYRTKTITNSSCVYIKGEIPSDLSERIVVSILNNKSAWLFKLGDNEYFYNVLLDYFTFANIENGLISAGYTEKIYVELPEHINTELQRDLQA